MLSVIEAVRVDSARRVLCGDLALALTLKGLHGHAASSINAIEENGAAEVLVDRLSRALPISVVVNDQHTAGRKARV
jgi:hypothetical protein